MQSSVLNTSDLEEARLVRSLATKNVTCLTFYLFQATLREERDKIVAEKATWKKAPEDPPEANLKAVSENWEAEKAKLVKDEAMAHEKVE